jgi:hypothetical protein
MPDDAGAARAASANSPDSPSQPDVELQLLMKPAGES